MNAEPENTPEVAGGGSGGSLPLARSELQVLQRHITKQKPLVFRENDEVAIPAVIGGIATNSKFERNRMRAAEIYLAMREENRRQDKHEAAIDEKQTGGTINNFNGPTQINGVEMTHEIRVARILAQIAEESADRTAAEAQPGRPGDRGPGTTGGGPQDLGAPAGAADGSLPEPGG